MSTPGTTRIPFSLGQPGEKQKSLPGVRGPCTEAGHRFQDEVDHIADAKEVVEAVVFRALVQRPKEIDHVTGLRLGVKQLDQMGFQIGPGQTFQLVEVELGCIYFGESMGHDLSVGHLVIHRSSHLLNSMLLGFNPKGSW